MAADTCEVGRNGLFFRTHAVAESAAEVVALLASPERLRAAGVSSRELAVQRFDLRKHVADLEHLYTSLAGATSDAVRSVSR